MPRFRPMGLGDIFDEAFDLYKKNFLYLLLVAAVVAVPLRVIAPALALWFPNEPSLNALLLDGVGDVLPAQALNQLGPVFTGPAIFAAFYPIASAIQIAALICACSACYLGEPRLLWPMYRTPLRRVIPLILTLLLYGILMTLGMVLCYVGILIPLTLLVFTGHAFALEHQNFAKALRRSSRLVSGYGSRVFGCLILLFAVSYIVGLGVRLPLTYAFDIASNIAPASNGLGGALGLVTALDRQRRIVADVTGGLAELLLTPFVFSVLTVLYYDLRVRKEAFDITLSARDLHYPSFANLTGYLPPVIPVPRSPAGKVPPSVSARPASGGRK